MTGAGDLEDVLASLHARGYESITPTDGYDEASDVVPLPEAYREEPREGWRRLLPRLYDSGDLDLVPDDLRATVERHGWVVQPAGKDAGTVTVVISENGV